MEDDSTIKQRISDDEDNGSNIEDGFDNQATPDNTIYESEKREAVSVISKILGLREIYRVEF